MENSSGLGIEPLAPVGVLDYPDAKLYMEVGNIIEQSFRVAACGKEPWTVDFIKRIPPGSWFIDVGASVGPYTLVAVSQGLNVVAIEPFFESYRRLCRNLALNGMLGKAIVLCCALGDRFKMDWLHIDDMRAGAASNRLGNYPKQTHHQMEVPVWTLDSLVDQFISGAPVYIKIDVDGGEAAVFKGAQKALTNPLVQGLMVEMPQKDEQEIVVLLESYGLKSKSGSPRESHSR